MRAIILTSLRTLLPLIFLFGTVSSGRAQVQQVQMHIGGYLCGN